MNLPIRNWPPFSMLFFSTYSKLTPTWYRRIITTMYWIFLLFKKKKKKSFIHVQTYCVDFHFKSPNNFHFQRPTTRKVVIDVNCFCFRNMYVSRHFVGRLMFFRHALLSIIVISTTGCRFWTDSNIILILSCLLLKCFVKKKDYLIYKYSPKNFPG